MLKVLKGQKFKKEGYLEMGKTVQCSRLMQSKLNMVDLKVNYKNQHKEGTDSIGCNQKIKAQSIWRGRERGGEGEVANTPTYT